jgi:cytochrome P450
MKYIDCIQEEVTRMYGPGTGVFLREATKDTQILNVPIKKGTSMSIKPMINHYNPDLF